MTNPGRDITAIHLSLLLREALAPLELARYWINTSALRDLPEGDGHAVMLVPGFPFGEEVLKPLKRSIASLGYTMYGWGEGRNLGLRAQIQRRLCTRLQTLQRRHRAKISLIGWSLGGIVVRELARAHPELVRSVITLGCPINGYEFADSLVGQTRLILRTVLRDDHAPLPRNPLPPVPCLSIFSKTDGFVNWRASIQEPAPNAANREVHASHIGLLYSPEVLRIIAERLAQPAKPVRARAIRSRSN